MIEITLNNGLPMPAMGIGASIIPRGDGKIRGNELATKQWQMYKHLVTDRPGLMYDISPSYGLCEYVLGNVIEATGKRDSMFIALKISNHEQRSGDVRQAFQDHLKVLNTDHVDLLMLHWPHPCTYLDAYTVLEEIHQEGGARAIGVSNFHEHHLDVLLGQARITPAVNQIEVQPLFTNRPLRDHCQGLGITVMAYSPLGRMHDVLIKHKVLRAVAAKYRKTVTQIILRWDIDSGMATLPRSLSPQHFDEALAVFDFELDPDDVRAIDAVNENIRLRFNPDTVDYSLV